LWSLWYFGRPESVYATVLHLRPERFPKVEDNATLMLNYKTFSGIFEGSWDLPRSFQDLEVFGSKASLVMTNGKVEVRKGRDTTTPAITPLAPEDAEPIAHMINAIKTGKPLDGMVALDINVQVIEIIDAAKESVKTGRPVKLAVR
jgi:predicted dehydrogenase